MLSFDSPEDLFNCLVCEQKTLFQALKVAADQIAIGNEDIKVTSIYLYPVFNKLSGYTLKELLATGGLGVIFQYCLLCRAASHGVKTNNSLTCIAFKLLLSDRDVK